MRFKDQDGTETDQNYNLSLSTSVADLRELVNAISKDEEEEEYTFYYGTVEVGGADPDPEEPLGGGHRARRGDGRTGYSHHVPARLVVAGSARDENLELVGRTQRGHFGRGLQPERARPRLGLGRHHGAVLGYLDREPERGLQRTQELGASGLLVAGRAAARHWRLGRCYLLMGPCGAFEGRCEAGRAQEVHHCTGLGASAPEQRLLEAG